MNATTREPAEVDRIRIEVRARWSDDPAGQAAVVLGSANVLEVDDLIAVLLDSNHRTPEGARRCATVEPAFVWSPASVHPALDDGRPPARPYVELTLVAADLAEHRDPWLDPAEDIDAGEPVDGYGRTTSAAGVEYDRVTGWEGVDDVDAPLPVWEP